MLPAAGRIELEIGSGEAEIAAPLLTMDDLAGHEPGITEQFRGLDHAAGFRALSRSYRTTPAALVFKRRRDIDGEAIAGAGILQESRRSAPPWPKWKSKPMATPLTASRSTRILATNCSAGRLAKRGVEGQHHRSVDAGGGQQPQFCVSSDSRNNLFIGAEVGPRMQLERQHRRRTASRRSAARWASSITER